MTNSYIDNFVWNSFQAIHNGRFLSTVSTTLSRRTLGGKTKTKAIQKSPELLTVVPGTEIFSRDGNLAVSSPPLETLLENKEITATFENPTLQASDDLTEIGKLMKSGIIQGPIDSAKGAASDILKFVNENSLDIQNDSILIAKSTAAEMAGLVDLLAVKAAATVGNAKTYIDEQTVLMKSAVQKIDHSISSLVPPEIKEVTQKAVDLIEGSAHLYNQNPEGYTIILLIGLSIPLVFVYSTIYGGFDGILRPSKVIEKLQSSDTVLVDIRSKEERLQNGVPLLKLTARGKGVAIPYQTLSSELARKVSNKQSLSIEILSAQIKSIAKIKRRTDVVLMDNRGELAKEVARACRGVGVSRVFIMDGGFDKYRKEDLQIDYRDFYEEGPLAIVADTAENLKNETKIAFAKSEYVAVTMTTMVLSGFVIANLHEVLKFIGVFGLEATVLLRYIIGDENIGDDFGDLYSKWQSFYAFGQLERDEASE